ncbi:MAG: hypothetical protein P4L87_01050 [Formivibrio sp.]|nr:hypothetical protein [Formivibrio sp.]
MFNLINLLYLGFVVAAQITVYSDGDYPLPADKDAVVEISTHREWWRDDSDCKYTGLLVPYVRDWELVQYDNDTREIKARFPPDLEHVIGRAFVINKKICKGKEAEPILRVGEREFIFAKGGLKRGHSFTLSDVFGMKEDERPKWFNQVFKRIERVAEYDPKAKEFMTYTSQALAKASAPTQSPQPEAPSTKPVPDAAVIPAVPEHTQSAS